MKLLILLMLFSGTVNAITVTQLIQRYGKSEIIKFISKRTDGEITIYFNGELKKARMPSPDYVTGMTINRDLASIGLTPNKVDKIFSEKKREKEKSFKVEEEEKLQRQYRQLVAKHERMAQEAKEAQWIGQDKLRQRDKYDLEVERVSRKSQTKIPIIELLILPIAIKIHKATKII